MNFPKVQTYFLELSNKICVWLDQAGYPLCLGEVMAMNPKWCQPLSVWKQYFSDWITNADPQALLDVKIFFDYRFIFGSEELVDRLTSHLYQVSEGEVRLLPKPRGKYAAIQAADWLFRQDRGPNQRGASGNLRH